MAVRRPRRPRTPHTAGISTPHPRSRGMRRGLSIRHAGRGRMGGGRQRRNVAQAITGRRHPVQDALQNRARHPVGGAARNHTLLHVTHVGTPARTHHGVGGLPHRALHVNGPRAPHMAGAVAFHAGGTHPPHAGTSHTPRAPKMPGQRKRKRVM